VDIVGGFDVHRKQITFDYMEMETGEIHRGKIRPANRESLRSWLESFTEQFPEHEAAIAVEATTGWRYVVEELERAGVEPHLAEPAETRSRQGPKKRAKTDRLDAAHLRDLLVMDRLPESWIPPEHLQEIRTLVRMRHSMIEERTAHQSSASTLSSFTTAILRSATFSPPTDARVWRSWSFPKRPGRWWICHWR
jgi:transposase